MEENKKKISDKAWISTTYFMEGLPYCVIRIMSSIFFTDIGMKERYIGYLNFLGLPWNFKFLWAPFIDIFKSKRFWMILLQALITIFTIIIALTNFLVPADGDPHLYMVVVTISLIILAFLSATNDISIDGYFMEGLNPEEQAANTGLRILAWRLSLPLVRSGFVAIAALVTYLMTKEGGPTPNKFYSWGWAFSVAALTMLGFTLFHYFKLPQFENKIDKSKKKASEIVSQFSKAFSTYLSQEKIILILLFIITYKIGDEILFSMNSPFLMRELGVTLGQMSWLGGVIGVIGSIAGTWIGGVWIKRKGLKKSIWPLTIFMNLNIWVYIWLAWVKPSAATNSGIIIISITHLYEMFAAGIGNAALVVYILRTCSQEYKASHYAFGSAIMSIFSTIFGGYGGRMVEAMGYLNLYLLSFVATIPGMVLLFFVPIKEIEVKK